MSKELRIEIDQKAFLTKNKKHAWNVAENIVIQEYSKIKNMTMRNSWYHIRELLSQKIGHDITEWHYNYFLANYEYYQSNKWYQWEKKYNFKRPLSKDTTIALYEETQSALAYISNEDFEFNRCQGFIFIEKSGFIRDLKVLSNNGWVVLAGQGFPTREIRERLKENYPDFPILIVHDFDHAGNIMPKIFENGSGKTDHIDLTFNNVYDLGLIEEDIEELNLPKEPEAEKFQTDERDWRVELNALTVLHTRGITDDKPLLWFITKKIKKLGLPLYKEEISSIEKLKEDITLRINEELAELLDTMFDNELSKVKDELIINLGTRETINLENRNNFIEVETFFKKAIKTHLKYADYIDIEETEQNVLLASNVLSDEKAVKIVRRHPKYRIEGE